MACVVGEMYDEGVVDTGGIRAVGVCAIGDVCGGGVVGEMREGDVVGAVGVCAIGDVCGGGVVGEMREGDVVGAVGVCAIGDVCVSGVVGEMREGDVVGAVGVCAIGNGCGGGVVREMREGDVVGAVGVCAIGRDGVVGEMREGDVVNISVCAACVVHEVMHVASIGCVGADVCIMCGERVACACMGVYAGCRTINCVNLLDVDVKIVRKVVLRSILLSILLYCKKIMYIYHTTLWQHNYVCTFSPSVTAWIESCNCGSVMLLALLFIYWRASPKRLWFPDLSL